MYDNFDEKDKLFDLKCQEMYDNYLQKWDLVKSMKIINKIENNPISESKIKNAEIQKDFLDGKVKSEDAIKMKAFNNTIDEMKLSNPMVLDYIIL